AETEKLVRDHAMRVTEPAGERTYAELVRLSEEGFRQADALGLLAPLGGSAAGLDRPLVDSPDFRLVAVLGESLEKLPVPNGLVRYARTLLRAHAPEDSSPRSIHRFRRATEPWALDALVFAGVPERGEDVRAARQR